MHVLIIFLILHILPPKLQSVEIMEEEEKCDEGQQREHNVKNMYYRCYDGQWRVLQCEEGWTYNPNYQACQAQNEVDKSTPPTLGVPPKNLNNSHQPEHLKSTHYKSNNYDFYYGQIYKDPYRNSYKRNNYYKRSYCDPPDYCSLGSYHEDPCDCKRFYQCNHHGPEHMSCGPGTAFNSFYNVCDYPYNVPLCKKLNHY